MDFWGSCVKREEAIALLKELATNQILHPKWVSMEDNEQVGYELRIRYETCDSAHLKDVVEKHKLTFKEANDILVIY
jgi:hypothetical protein